MPPKRQETLLFGGNGAFAVQSGFELVFLDVSDAVEEKGVSDFHQRKRCVFHVVSPLLVSI